MKNKRSHFLRVLGFAGLLAAAGTLENDANGNSVVEFMTAKSLPAATVSVIDPESGTSQGTAGSDVNIAVGDIILFRFSVASAPASAIDGIQSYITEYVPDGTQVVGARFLDENGNTIEPRRAGLALDGCSTGSGCNSYNSVPSDLCSTNGTCDWHTAPAGHGPGSVAQSVADTGIFFSTDTRTKQSPNNAFLSLDNGVGGGFSGNDEPRAIDPEIVALLGDTSAPYFAHNSWDDLQMKAFASQNSTVTNGIGNPPFKYGSIVAGPDTFYPFEATADSDGGRPAELNDINGPWQRMKSPGSQKGAGTQPGSNPSGAKATRVGTDRCALNFPGPLDGSAGKTLYPVPGDCGGTETDITPANPVAANAVRWALGDPRVGEIRYVEVALKVTSVPISSTFGTGGGNVDCGEVAGADIANKLGSTGGDNLSWRTFIGHPECVFLRLKLDVTPDKKLATTGDHITYTVFGKNLSVNNETNAKFFLEFDGSAMSFVSSSPAPTRAVSCNGGRTCEEYDFGTMAPSQEFNLSVVLGVGGIGGITDVVIGQYQSDQLDAIDPNGFQTTALTVVGKATEPVITLDNVLDPTANHANAGGTWNVTGTVQNLGTDTWTATSFRPFLPTGWTISNFKVAGTTLTCTTSGNDSDDGSALATNSPRCSGGGTFTAGQSKTLTFTVNVAGAAATGLYQLDIRTVGSQSMFQSFESMFHKALVIPVGQNRTAKPVLNCPINSTAPTISGTSESGAKIRLLFDLMQRNGTNDLASGTTWSFGDYSSFGELYGGLDIRATAQASGKLESELSDGCANGVTEVKQCSDGIDNDGDGLIDFPADPGCTSLGDNSEVDPVFPQCNDRIDNDGDGFIDFPMDPNCSSLTDNSELGTGSPVGTQCNDGIDNDGDLAIDGADPDCAAANSLGREVTLRQCQDGIDNDSPPDGKIDFPNDPGCDSAFDDDESDLSSVLDTKGRLLIAMDTSGSMNGITCAADTFTGGDGTTECPGADQACATCANGACGNTAPDDSRLFQVTDGMSNVVAAFGDVDYALMRFHEQTEPFSCPTSFATQQSGGWQGGGIAPCTGGFAAGDLLVSFDPDNEQDILTWMDHDDDYNGVPPPGTDWELRGSGTTPLAGIITSAQNYLIAEQLADQSASCRPYRIILVTDGNETCGGDPVAAARTAWQQHGFPVNVIGMATTDAPTIAQLNSIAAAGNTGQAFLVNDQAGLSNAMAQIIQSSILVEKCNGADDDCDGAIDEGYNIGASCDNGERGACFRQGAIACTGLLSSGCNAPQVSGTTEICNGIDDDCDGVIDEDTGAACSCNPLPEICNGRDDDCDGVIDEGVLPGVGDQCGPSTGECNPGAIACVNGALTCQGGTGPVAEQCDGLDNDCDTFVDEVANPCYTFPTGCTADASGNYTCKGICQSGVQDCTDIANNSCPGEVGPATELCNGIDDDCDGVIDNGFNVGAACDNGELGACHATGVLECNAAGGVVCTAPNIAPGTETCNGVDDDCDGTIDEAADLGPPIGNQCGGGGTCGIGTFACQDSQGNTGVPGDHVVCVGSQTGTPEQCNGFDDDCDSVIDEDVPGMGAACVPSGDPTGLHYPPGTCATGAVCDDPTSVCRLGGTACLGGSVQCTGWIGPQAEIPCNGIDEDCDGVDDTSCPNGEACVQNGCRLPCGPGEFPCPLGQYCDTTDAPSPGVCVPDPCAALDCGPGTTCDRNANPPACVSLCDSVTCPTGLSCVNGVCQDCFTLGCTTGNKCVRDPNSGDGVCQPDACANNNCTADQFCQNGTCVGSTCSPDCETGQICIGGTCANNCPDCQVGQVCDYGTGQCTDDQCVDADGNATRCPIGDVCNPYDGQCEPDPCSQIQCNVGNTCTILPDGTASCFSPPTPPKTVIYAGGGGCDTGGSSGAGGLLLVGAAVVLVRRRRRS